MIERMTLEEARDLVRDNLREGLVCPCCEQFAKVYKRKLNGAMAASLVLIARHFKHSTEWLHVENYLKELPGIPASLRGDFAKLRYWGLIERMEGEREDGSNRVGYYRITPLGKDFVEGRVKVPGHVYLFNSECIGHSDETLHIGEALGTAFDYAELMSA
jgi:hypothetical protein